MGNHNVLITNPQGERRHQFLENVSRRECEKWLEEYGPAPVGWMYQVTNTNRRRRVYPDHVLVTGWTKDGTFVEQVKARHKTNFGWYTIRMAKRDLRKRGSEYFTLEKVWTNGQQQDSSEVE